MFDHSLCGLGRGTLAAGAATDPVTQTRATSSPVDPVQARDSEQRTAALFLYQEFEGAPIHARETRTAEIESRVGTRVVRTGPGQKSNQLRKCFLDRLM
jgi:hypothetical protein